MNRIYPEQLQQSLSRQLAKVYFLVGPDLLLLSESEDMIYQAAIKNGFDEKNNIQIDSSTDWDNLIETCQSQGLFFSKQVINLILPENMTASIQKGLQALVPVLSADILLMVQISKLSKTMEKQAWFLELNQYDTQAVLINCQTPTIENLPRWVKNRTQAMGLNADDEAIQQLCYSYENNLLALKQTLQLLDLLYEDRKLTYNRVVAVAEQSSVFTPFQWVDALLLGKPNRARRILSGLQAEDIQPIILLRTLQKELVTLLELSKPTRLVALQDPLLLDQLKTEFDRLKIWQNRRPIYLTAVKRFSYQKLYETIQELADIERTAKQEFSDNVWTQLRDLSVKMSV